ncbi:MAG: 3-deoxy-7-phosphoheptulonate synthase class II [Syntrophales bacterium]
MSVPVWSKSSWRSYTARQQPRWPDVQVLEETLETLSRLPAVVFAGETRTLIRQLADAVEGKVFVLQCGDCSEDFDKCNGPVIHNLLRVILQMSIILAYAGEKRIVNIGRISGQYAKPRSSDTEKIGDQEIPVYRGDMVNSPEPTLEARTPDPRRLLEGYFRAVATLNLVRAFTRGGYAAIDRANAWHRETWYMFPPNNKYDGLIKGIQKAIKFMSAIGIDSNAPQLNQIILYTSHEGLLLEYEEAMTRIDTTTGNWYDTSAHMLWIGDRTRQLDGAHVEFMRGICNPVGVKIGPNYEIDEIRTIIRILNPNNDPGRLTLITRFGADEIDVLLPPLVRAIRREGFQVLWCCDPMHGNTYLNNHFKKTRKFDNILTEVRKYFHIHHAEGSIAGGVHLELTGEDVSECIGGSRQISDSDLNLNYLTNCDPRLNAEQAVELAFEIADLLNL